MRQYQVDRWNYIFVDIQTTWKRQQTKFEFVLLGNVLYSIFFFRRTPVGWGELMRFCDNCSRISLFFSPIRIAYRWRHWHALCTARSILHFSSFILCNSKPCISFQWRLTFRSNKRYMKISFESFESAGTAEIYSAVKSQEAIQQSYLPTHGTPRKKHEFKSFHFHSFSCIGCHWIKRLKWVLLIYNVISVIIIIRNDNNWIYAGKI